MTFLFKYKLLYTSYVKIIKEPTFSSILLTTNRKPKLGVHLYSSGKQREKMIHISLPLARQRRVDNFVLVSGYEQKNRPYPQKLLLQMFLLIVSTNRTSVKAVLAVCSVGSILYAI